MEEFNQDRGSTLLSQMSHCRVGGEEKTIEGGPHPTLSQEIPNIVARWVASILANIEDWIRLAIH